MSERDELVGVVKGLLAKRSDSAAVRQAYESDTRFDHDLWRTLCEQVGVAALCIPEEYDGAGGTLEDTAAVLTEVAYALTPAPLLASSLATVTLLAGGTEESKAALLPRLAAGEIGALAWNPLAGDLVLDGARADVVLSVSDGVVRHHPTAIATDVPALDHTMRLARIDLGEGVEVGTLDGEVLWGLAAALVAAEQAGVARRGLDMTVAYAKERVQFGRPIGSFQALKHRMADMLMRAEMIRSASLGAASAAAAYLEEPSADNAGTVVERGRVAKAYCTDALEQIDAEVIQLHGGIGITWEHDAHLVFKRGLALNTLLGPAHRARAALV